MAYFSTNSPTPPMKGTQITQFERAFKKKLRDKSIMSLITNKKYKGRFQNKGTTIEIPIMPDVDIHHTYYGDNITYQTFTSNTEKFTINRESYYALKFLEEDVKFAQFNIEDPINDEATIRLGEAIETRFFQDILGKCHEKNQGANAGFVSGKYNLGTVTTGATVDKENITDYILEGLTTLREQPGGKTGNYRIVVPSYVGYLLQTSDLKKADWMGDAQSVLRKDVQLLGSIGGADIIVSDKILSAIAAESVAITNDDANATKEDVFGNTNVYPVMFVDTEAICYADEVSISDKMRDANAWGTYHRMKVIYDWFVMWPEKFAVGYIGGSASS